MDTFNNILSSRYGTSNQVDLGFQTHARHAYRFTNAFLLINTSLVNRDPARDDLKVLKVAASAIAIEEGNPRAANMVALGAYVGGTGIVEPEVVEEESEVIADEDDIEVEEIAEDVEDEASNVADRQAETEPDNPPEQPPEGEET